MVLGLHIDTCMFSSLTEIVDFDTSLCLNIGARNTYGSARPFCLYSFDKLALQMGTWCRLSCMERRRVAEST